MLAQLSVQFPCTLSASPQLSSDGLLRFRQRAHGVDEVEREKLFQSQHRTVVLPEDGIPFFRLLDAQVRSTLLPAPANPIQWSTAANP